MKKTALLLLTAMLLASNAEAKDKETISITPVGQDADAANDGIIYTLPKTIVRIKVEAEVTIKKAGPFYRYSNKFLNLTNVVTEDSKKWEITKVSIDTYGKADNTRRFKISGAQLPSVVLNTDNILAGINAQCPISNMQQAEEESNADIPEITFDNVKLGGNVLTKTSNAAMAEEVAHSIYKLREKRLSLLGGEDATVLNDEGSYDRVLKEISTLEEEYTSLFAGKTVKMKVVKYYDVEPGAVSLNSTVLFRFSDKDGFMDAMDITGKPVYADIEFAAGGKLNAYSDDSKQRKQNPVTGLRYIMPGEITVKVIDRNVLLAEKTVLCTENGQEATLPLDMITDGCSIILNTTSGTIVSITAQEEKRPTDKKKK